MIAAWGSGSDEHAEQVSTSSLLQRTVAHGDAHAVARSLKGTNITVSSNNTSQASEALNGSLRFCLLRKEHSAVLNTVGTSMLFGATVMSAGWFCNVAQQELLRHEKDRHVPVTHANTHTHTSTQTQRLTEASKRYS